MYLAAMSMWLIAYPPPLKLVNKTAKQRNTTANSRIEQGTKPVATKKTADPINAKINK